MFFIVLVVLPMLTSQNATDDVCIEACIACTKGEIQEHLNNFEVAADYYRKALQWDPQCTEAIQALYHSQLLDRAQGKLTDDLDMN